MTGFPRHVACIIFAAVFIAAFQTAAAPHAVGPCRFDVAEDREGAIGIFETSCTEAARRIFREVGATRAAVRTISPVTVRIVGAPSEIAAVSPKGRRPPDWSIAVAYPDLRLVVIALRHRDGQPVESPEIELEHELSHIAVRDVVGAHPIPRWLSEGIAIMQSERSSLLRRGTLTMASWRGAELPLAALHDYPRGDSRVQLAYAEAADFVAFLLRRGGWSGIRTALGALARGERIDSALERAYGSDLAALEAAWLSDLRKEPLWIAAVTGSTALWIFVTALSALAYAQARRRRRRRLAAMAVEEAREDARATADLVVSTRS